MTHDVIFMDPFELQAHEFNQKIYRDAPDDEFLESIKSLGVLEPVLAWDDNGKSVVISGHRRMNAARMLKMKEVPVIMQDEVKDDNSAVRMLILSNRQRDKTNEQRAREYSMLLEVEQRLSLERKKLHHEKLKETDKKGKAKTIAAQAVGMDYRTAEKAQAVIEAIDEAEVSGDDAKAEDLRSKLNRSVSKGHKAVQRDRRGTVDGLDNPVPDELKATFDVARAMRGLIYKAGEIKASIRVISESEGGELIPLRAVEADCTNVSNALIAAKPHAVCPICKGKGCEGCDHLGWMHRDQYNALPEGLRSDK